MKLEWAPEEHIDVTFTPADDPLAPVLVIWPAFGAPATFYRHLTPALARAGMASLVVEYPGRETRDGVGRHSTYGYDALATSVHNAVLRYVSSERPDAPVYLLGHSLGGHVSLFASAVQRAGRADTMPRGLILVASASPYWRGYGLAGLPRSFAGTALMSLVSRGVGYWPGDRLRFWGRQSRVLVADWARFARSGRVRPAGARTDYMRALAEYDGDVLAISLPDDPLAPIAALERLLQLAPAAHVTRRHAAKKVGHIQWVRHHEEIVDLIASWVHSRESATSSA